MPLRGSGEHSRHSCAPNYNDSQGTSNAIELLAKQRKVSIEDFKTISFVDIWRV